MRCFDELMFDMHGMPCLVFACSFLFLFYKFSLSRVVRCMFVRYNNMAEKLVLVQNMASLRVTYRGDN